jgi:hypothetical protein
LLCLLFFVLNLGKQTGKPCIHWCPAALLSLPGQAPARVTFGFNPNSTSAKEIQMSTTDLSQFARLAVNRGRDPASAKFALECISRAGRSPRFAFNRQAAEEAAEKLIEVLASLGFRLVEVPLEEMEGEPAVVMADGFFGTAAALISAVATQVVGGAADGSRAVALNFKLLRQVEGLWPVVLDLDSAKQLTARLVQELVNQGYTPAIEDEPW